MTAGTVVGTDIDWPGDSLAVATLATDEVLQVGAVVDFDEEDGGWLIVGDSAPMQYLSADEDASTVTLAAPVGAAYEADTPVYTYDPDAPADEKRTITHIAQVRLHDEGGTVSAVITDERVITAGVDNLVGASVLIEPVDEDEDSWTLGQVVGREPVVDPDRFDQTKFQAAVEQFAPGGGAGAGQTFLDRDPEPADAEGLPENHGWWVVDTLTPTPPAVSKVLRFFRLVGGVWAEQEIVSGEAAYFQNALIEALQVTGLNAVTMQGGSIFIAQGTAASQPEAFSGTSLPGTWTSTKVNYNGTGSAGASVPGVSVVASGPTGQDGSALLLDFGAAGLSGATAEASGEVYTNIGLAANAEISTRFRSALNRDLAQPDDALLAIRSGDGAAFSATWDAVTLDLASAADFSGGTRSFAVRVWTNGTPSSLGNYSISTDPTTHWHRAKFRLLAGQVGVKVWRDGTAEPAWTVFQQTTLSAAGRASLSWRQFTGLYNTRGQDFWLDEFNVTTYATGFTVNPDASGSWPLAFQRGEVSSGTLTAGTPKDVTVTFVTPFGTAPTVVINQVGVTNPLNSAVCAADVTSSGFTARFVRSTGTASIQAHWSAGPAD